MHSKCKLRILKIAAHSKSDLVDIAVVAWLSVKHALSAIERTCVFK